ncbi:MAG TPA: hypothetical protein VHV99_03255 [Paraburkholderia sp.]|jgi:hypothetical protein|nr:hypothetical protein [Paraburkholderia sp.]
MSASSGEAVEISEIDIMVRVEDGKIRDAERGPTSAREAEELGRRLSAAQSDIGGPSAESRYPSCEP